MSLKDEFTEKVNEIKKANKNVLEPKKKLMIEIVFSIILAVIFTILYVYFRSREILVCALLVPPFMVGYCMHAYLKEKRQDKSFEKEEQNFFSGAKYRQKEWKTAYYEYKEKHSFEIVSSKGMKYDLKRRYRTMSGFGSFAWLLLLLFSIGAIFYPIKGWYLGYSILGIFFGGYCAVWSIYNVMGGPVIKLYKTRTDLSEIERSYMKGKMLSYQNNGINFGRGYTVVYNRNDVIPIDNNTIQAMTRKMVRVKNYENSLYSGQEYKYYVHIIYTNSNGNTAFFDVHLDEFQCEMIIMEYNRIFYPETLYENIISEEILNSVST